MTPRRTPARALNARIKELRRVPASQIQPHPENWRIHPQSQQTALQGVIEQVGIADAVLAYEPSPGELVLIDGHLRRETLGDTEAEARVILATHDPLADMALQDDEMMRNLLSRIEAGNDDVQNLLALLNTQAQEWSPELLEAEPPDPENSVLKGKIVIQCLQADAQAIADRIAGILVEYSDASVT